MSIFSRLKGAATVLSRNYTGFLTSNRAYGSAALQLDYDFDDYEDDDTESKMYGNRTMEDSDGSVSGRGIQWVIIGDPMANRHVYAERLSKLLQVPHISMGTLVRQELHPRSSLYMQIASSINQGKLVPEEVIFGLLSKRLEEGYCRGETGFILDGIPRTKIQAEILEQIVDIDLVLNLKCPECLLTKHIANHTCSTCEGLVNIGSSKLSLNLNSKDNQMGLSAASDAKNSVLKETHRISAEQRKPLEEYYRKQKKLLEFQVAGGPGETWQGLLAALQLQHMSGAVTSSQKLSA